MARFAKWFISVIALIVLAALWTAGNPPAKSIFWSKIDVEVTGHRSEAFETGFGPIERTVVLTRLSPGIVEGPVLLAHPESADAETVINRYPVGATIQVRARPDGEIAYEPSNSPTLLYPALIASFFFGLITAYFVSGWLQSAGVLAPRSRTPIVVGLALFAFGAVPWFLTIFAWNFGEPPPRSILWPRETVEVVSSNARVFNVGNGTQAAYVEVDVREQNTANLAAQPMRGVTYSSVAISDAREMTREQFAPGTKAQAMRSPEGILYLVRWRFSDVVVLIFAGITGIFSYFIIIAGRNLL
ncbi:MAG: hypothetical protein AAGI92_09080 [Pseudomonadota bacterium]